VPIACRLPINFENLQSVAGRFEHGRSIPGRPVQRAGVDDPRRADALIAHLMRVAVEEIVHAPEQWLLHGRFDVTVREGDTAPGHFEHPQWMIIDHANKFSVPAESRLVAIPQHEVRRVTDKFIDHGFGPEIAKVNEDGATAIQKHSHRGARRIDAAVRVREDAETLYGQGNET